jgi:hypothetical protein
MVDFYPYTTIVYGAGFWDAKPTDVMLVYTLSDDCTYIIIIIVTGLIRRGICKARRSNRKSLPHGTNRER